MVACAVVRPELFALAAAVVRNDGVRRVQNALRGAVILLQTDDLRALVLLFKVQNVGDGRTAEAVDALVVVAHDADIFIAPGQQRGQQVLQMVRILILVDEDIAELALVIVAHLLKLLQKLHGQKDDVVKIHGVGRTQPPLILRINLRNALEAVVVARVLGKVLRRGHLILGAGDHAQHGARRENFLVKIAVAQDFLQNALGVGGIVDREAALVAESLDLAAQDAAAGGVEGHRPDVIGLGAEHGRQTILQLICSLVGKGDGDDGPRCGRVQRAQLVNRRAVLFCRMLQLALKKFHILLGDIVGDLVGLRGTAEADEIGNAVDEHGRLAASRARQQQQRPLRGADGLELHGIHAGKALFYVLSSRGQKPLFVAFCHSTLPVLCCLYFTPFRRRNKEPNCAIGYIFFSRFLI